MSFKTTASITSNKTTENGALRSSGVGASGVFLGSEKKHIKNSNNKMYLNVTESSAGKKGSKPSTSSGKHRGDLNNSNCGTTSNNLYSMIYQNRT
jgi:hypothetical protein